MLQYNYKLTKVSNNGFIPLHQSCPWSYWQSWNKNNIIKLDITSKLLLSHLQDWLTVESFTTQKIKDDFFQYLVNDWINKLHSPVKVKIAFQLTWLSLLQPDYNKKNEVTRTYKNCHKMRLKRFDFSWSIF